MLRGFASILPPLLFIIIILVSDHVVNIIIFPMLALTCYISYKIFYSQIYEDKRDLKHSILHEAAYYGGLHHMKHSTLHEAASYGNLHQMILLLKAGKDIEGRDNEGNTPLHEAVCSWYPEAVYLLLKFGAQIEVFNKKGQSPFYLAIINENMDVVELLIKYGAKIHAPLDKLGKTSIHFALLTGQSSMARFLIEKSNQLDVEDAFQWTALHIVVAILGNAEFAELLVDRGANVAQKDYCNRTPLHYAVIQGSISMIKLLLERGAPINCRDVEGKTPLHMVYYEFSLQDDDDGVGLASYLQDTYIHLVSHENGRNSLAIVKVLLQYGADINAMDNSNNTLLNLAAAQYDQKLVRFLLDYEANNLDSDKD